MKRTGTELKNKMSRQERREARLRQEKLRLQKKSKLTLIVYAVIRLIVVGVLVRSAFNGQIESVYTCLLTLVLLLLPSILERKLGVRLPAGLEITVVVFIFAAEILGEIACFYVTVPFWDKALHTTSGFIYAAVGLFHGGRSEPPQEGQLRAFTAVSGARGVLFLHDDRRIVGNF